MNETIFKMITATHFCVLLLLIFNSKIFSQDYDIQPKHGIEVQFGANSPVVSLKYQRYFWLNAQQHITASTGVGLFYGVNFNQDLTYSIGDGRNFWEIGVLGVFTSSRLKERTDYDYFILPMTGYKYISPKWFYAKINFSPYFTEGNFHPHAGVSFGFHLKEKKYIESNQNINSIRYKKD